MKAKLNLNRNTISIEGENKKEVFSNAWAVIYNSNQLDADGARLQLNGVNYFWSAIAAHYFFAEGRISFAEFVDYLVSDENINYSAPLYRANHAPRLEVEFAYSESGWCYDVYNVCGAKHPIQLCRMDRGRQGIGWYLYAGEPVHPLQPGVIIGVSTPGGTTAEEFTTVAGIESPTIKFVWES